MALSNFYHLSKQDLGCAKEIGTGFLAVNVSFQNAINKKYHFWTLSHPSYISCTYWLVFLLF